MLVQRAVRFGRRRAGRQGPTRAPPQRGRTFDRPGCRRSTGRPWRPLRRPLLVRPDAPRSGVRQPGCRRSFRREHRPVPRFVCVYPERGKIAVRAPLTRTARPDVRIAALCGTRSKFEGVADRSGGSQAFWSPAGLEVRNNGRPGVSGRARGQQVRGRGAGSARADTMHAVSAQHRPSPAGDDGAGRLCERRGSWASRIVRLLRRTRRSLSAHDLADSIDHRAG